jgi:hypothetical protein
MRPCDVFDYFSRKYGTEGEEPNYSQIARDLALTRSTVHAWKYRERVSPLQAARIHELTGGELRFDPAEYSTWNKSKKLPRKKRRNGHVAA